jgi:hypothetical protein
MLTAAEIGNIGERHVTAALAANGWRCYRNTQLPGATDIEATSANRSLLVQVKTAVYPNSPSDLSGEDKRAIVGRASRNQKEAWLAQLQVNREGALIGNITWTNLS